MTNRLTGGGSAWKVVISTMNRVLTILLAAVIVFGGWALLKAKVLSPSASRDIPGESTAAVEKVLWTAEGSNSEDGGPDPRAVFSIGLNRYLGQQVSGASTLPLDEIDPAVVSQTDDTAHLAATVGGIRYHGRLKWANHGWELIQIAREK